MGEGGRPSAAAGSARRHYGPSRSAATSPIGRVAEFLGDERCVVEDHRQKVVEIVRDAAGQLAQAFQPLGLLQWASRCALSRWAPGVPPGSGLGHFWPRRALGPPVSQTGPGRPWRRRGPFPPAPRTGPWPPWPRRGPGPRPFVRPGVLGLDALFVHRSSNRSWASLASTRSLPTRSSYRSWALGVGAPGLRPPRTVLWPPPRPVAPCRRGPQAAPWHPAAR